MFEMRDLDELADVDLASDEAWQPVFNPYLGRVTPQWWVTKEARLRMKLVERRGPGQVSCDL